MKKVLSGVVILLVIAGVRIGLRYGGAELASKASKNDPWEQEFRAEFTNGCVGEIKDSYGSKSPKISSVIEEYANEYCHCHSGAVESAKILETKYNTMTGEEAYIKRSHKALENYYASNEGSVEIDKCRTIAKSKSKIEDYAVSVVTEGNIVACESGILKQIDKDVDPRKAKNFASGYCSCFVSRVMKKLPDGFWDGDERSPASEKVQPNLINYYDQKLSKFIDGLDDTKSFGDFCASKFMNN